MKKVGPKTFRIDAIQQHLDANELLFLNQELEQIESELFETKMTQLPYRELVPVNNNFNPGTQSISYKQLTYVGMAKIISGNAKDLPRVGAYIQKIPHPVHIIATSFAYTHDDIRAAAMSGMPLDATEVKAARRAIEQKQEEICFNGDTATGLPGFFTNANITVKVAAAGVGGTVWADKTALEIMKDVTDGIFDVVSATDQHMAPDTIALPVSQYGLLASTLVPNTNITLLQSILNNEALGINRIIATNRLQNRFVGGTLDGMVIYKRDPEVIEQRIVMEMTVHNAQVNGLEFMFPVESKVGGAVSKFPLGAEFVVNI